MTFLPGSNRKTSDGTWQLSTQLAAMIAGRKWDSLLPSHIHTYRHGISPQLWVGPREHSGLKGTVAPAALMMGLAFTGPHPHLLFFLTSRVLLHKKTVRCIKKPLFKRRIDMIHYLAQTLRLSKWNQNVLTIRNPKNLIKLLSRFLPSGVSGSKYMSYSASGFNVLVCLFHRKWGQTRPSQATLKNPLKSVGFDPTFSLICSPKSRRQQLLHRKSLSNLTDDLDSISQQQGFCCVPQCEEWIWFRSCA